LPYKRDGYREKRLKKHRGSKKQRPKEKLVKNQRREHEKRGGSKQRNTENKTHTKRREHKTDRTGG
jgi:hypothetical protein